MTSSYPHPPPSQPPSQCFPIHTHTPRSSLAFESFAKLSSASPRIGSIIIIERRIVTMISNYLQNQFDTSTSMSTRQLTSHRRQSLISEKLDSVDQINQIPPNWPTWGQIPILPSNKRTLPEILFSKHFHISSKINQWIGTRHSIVAKCFSLFIWMKWTPPGLILVADITTSHWFDVRVWFHSSTLNHSLWPGWPTVVHCCTMFLWDLDRCEI